MQDRIPLSDYCNYVFVYTISDGKGGTDTANIITITITGVNDDVQQL